MSNTEQQGSEDEAMHQTTTMHVPPAPGSEPIPAPAPARSPFAGLEGIRIGRYNDNNKSYAKTQTWYKAEELFKQKKYTESFAAVFDYIKDEAEDNLIYRQEGDCFSFELVQGSKKVSGTCDGKQIVAYAPVALMETPSVPVMRRMLDLNYTLYYCRAALNDQSELCIMLDAPITMAAPNLLYYGLREIATKADRQDDLLLADFSSLKPTHVDHMEYLAGPELDIKYRYFQQWIRAALDRAATLNQDSFAGAIAYLYLSVLYRIEFLLVPEAGLLAELERISNLYWIKKEETALIERNQLMKDALAKLAELPRETFAAGVYRTKATFAIAPPAPAEKYKEHIVNANRDAAWYIDNKYPDLALALNEYGVVYNQYAYSVPRLQKDLSIIYMAVLHAAFFKELGMEQPFYDAETGTFNQPAIEQAVNDAISYFPDKYTDLHWDHSRIKYDSLYGFAISFTDQLAHLNMELKK